ncbi:hypothetical protein ACHWQZ_G005469 [Mnemiopsis leidyi]
MSKKAASKSEELSDAKLRIKELEKENNVLKSRLDELRRAKLQTIIKKEGKTVAKGPTLGRKASNAESDDSPSPDSSACLDPKLEEELQKYKQKVAELESELEALKEQHKKDMAAAKTSMLQDLRNLRDEHVTELERLAEEYSNDLDKKEVVIQNFKQGVLSDSASSAAQFKDIIAKLREENLALREQNQMQSAQLVNLELRVKDSLTELSEKEAAWCELEEKLKVQIQKSWGEKYQAWMLATEKKIEDLRKTNEFLKSALERQQGGGS